ncbi:MAG: hypothetical protein KY462_14245 [Actinobacteria bacterium]|nr:hypothetical protein [Actinomycetota bacterium]
MAQQPTDEQVATIVRHLARKQLEIERGLRPPEHLAPHLTPAAYRHMRRRPCERFPRGGPVLPKDLGSVRLTRYSDGHVYASLSTRQQDDRWGALTMQLKPGPDGRFVVSELERVRPRPLQRETAPEHQQDIEEQIRRADDERRLTEAALRAEEKRLSSINNGEARTEVKDLVSAYRSRLSDLDAELQDLGGRQQARKAVSEHEARDSAAKPAAYITKLLGEQPTDEGRLGLWRAARDAIEEYRAHWRVDGEAALGQPPQDENQSRQREEVVQFVRTITPQLRRGTDRVVGHDRWMERADGLGR